MTLWPGLVRNVLLRRVIRHRQPTATSRSMPCPWPPARSQCAYGSVAEFGSMRLSYRPPIWCVSLKSGYLLLYLIWRQFMHYAIHTVGYSRNHRSRPIWDLSGVCLSAAQWPQIKSTQHSKVSAHPRAKYSFTAYLLH